MYADHPAFVKPENHNVKIWRYIDFTKFVDLLIKGELYFTRCDNFEDPFEGSWPEANFAIREMRPDLFEKGAPTQAVKSMAKMTYQQFRKYMVVNCWHLNEYESAAMWKLYLKSNEGIAIQSTYNKLISSFNNDNSYTIHVGLVQYIDYKSYFMPEGNLFYPFLHKRKSFEHEHELRALIMMPIPGEGGSLDFSKEPTFQGKFVPVNLDTLIETIFVCPSAPSWFFSLVKDVMGKFNIKKEIKQSQLNEAPFY